MRHGRRALLCCYDSFCLQRIIIVYTEEGPRRAENFVNKNLVGTTNGVFKTPSSFPYHIRSPTRGNFQDKYIYIYIKFNFPSHKIQIFFTLNVLYWFAILVKGRNLISWVSLGCHMYVCMCVCCVCVCVTVFQTVHVLWFFVLSWIKITNH